MMMNIFLLFVILDWGE